MVAVMLFVVIVMVRGVLPVHHVGVRDISNVERAMELAGQTSIILSRLIRENVQHAGAQERQKRRVKNVMVKAV
jgi:hypothetical protein